jgi:type II secretory pathway component PulF
LAVPVLGTLATVTTHGALPALAMLAAAGFRLRKALQAAAEPDPTAPCGPTRWIRWCARRAAGLCAGAEKRFRVFGLFAAWVSKPGQLPLMLQRSQATDTEVQRQAMSLATMLEPLLIGDGCGRDAGVLAVLLPIIQPAG